MKQKPKYRKNTNGMQIALLVSTIVALCAIVVLGSVLIWYLLTKPSEEAPKSTENVPASSIEQITDEPIVTDPPQTLPNGSTDSGNGTTEEPAPTEPTVPDVTFSQDLSAYEEYMNPQGEKRDAFLVLINADNPLGKDFVPEGLTKIPNCRNTTYDRMDPTAAKALEAMFLELYAAGYTDVKATTAYRSYSQQDYFFNLYVDREMQENSALSRAEAEKIVLTYSCRAGTSEHQTGLATDMHNLASADVSFAKTDAAKWLAENCWKFGFILRFPEDKVDVTGISFEPWHFRFVGRYHAYQIHSAGLCLEEYSALLK